MEQITANGFIWKYKQDNTPIEKWVERVKNKKTAGKPRKPIKQLDINH